MGEGSRHLCTRNEGHYLYLRHSLVAETDDGLGGSDGFIDREGLCQAMPSHIEVAETELAYTAVGGVVGL